MPMITPGLISRGSFAAHLFCHLEHRFFRWDRDVFERRRKWDRDVHRAQALDRRIQIIESALGDDGGEFGRHSVAAIALVHQPRELSS